MKVAKRFFLSCGASEGSSCKNALDLARIAAGVDNINLLTGCNLVPPQTRQTAPEQLAEAATLPAVIASICSETPGEIISAGIAVAWPTETSRAGLVMEYAASGHKEDIEAIARRMAEDGLKARGLAVREIHSIAVQHRVEQLGSVLAVAVIEQNS